MDSGIQQQSHADITFGENRDRSPVIITDEIASLLSRGGHDPSTINKITWPLFGASNHATAKFLVRIDGNMQDDVFYGDLKFDVEAKRPNPTVVTLKATENTSWLNSPYVSDGKPIALEMYPIDLLLVMENGLTQYFIVEMVDERYWWNMYPIVDRYEDPQEPGSFIDGMFKNGLNRIDRSNRRQWVQDSLFSFEEEDPGEEPRRKPWTAKEVLESICQRELDLPDNTNETDHMDGNKEFPFMKDVVIHLSPVGGIYQKTVLFDPPEAEEEGNKVVGYDIIDVNAVGRSFAEFLDEVLTSSGMALLCIPESHGYWIEDEGYHPDHKPGRSLYYLTTPADRSLFNAALFVPRDDVDSPKRLLLGQNKSLNYGDQNIIFDNNHDKGHDILRVSIPEKCVVFFPKTINNKTQETDKLVSLTTDFGIPQTAELDEEYEQTNITPFTLGGNQKTIHGHLHARFSLDEDGEEYWQNELDCIAYANRLSERYYRRFRLPFVDIKQHGFTSNDPSHLTIGSQVVVWHYSELGPTTHWYGDIDNPLLGFRTNLKQSQDDIQTSGGGLVYPRNDGSVMIEAGSGVGTTLHQGIIMGWENNVPTYNAKYFARSATDSALIIGPMQPIRTHSTAYVNCQPLQINDPCIIGLIPEELVNEAHDIVDAGLGRMAVSGSSELLSGLGLFERLMGDTPVDSGTSFEYFRLEDGRICVLYVFEIPSTVRCELLSQPGAAASSTRNQESFYTRSNLYGY